jgi:hypothetical protein
MGDSGFLNEALNQELTLEAAKVVAGHQWGCEKWRETLQESGRDGQSTARTDDLYVGTMVTY